ncbi:MAG: F0F1 ATP synthase subunit B [Lachnospiraceae bacterium]
MENLLNIQYVFLAANDDESIVQRVFGLDAQLLMDAVIVACAVLFLFVLLSYLVFNPARELLAKRREKVVSDLEDAAKEKEDAVAFKSEYEAKLANAEKDADAIISEGRRRANKREEEIVAEAKEEAARILARTEKEIELEKAKAKDEVKQEMASVAQAMAGKFIAEQMDAEKQAALVDEVINEMGDSTWQ